MDVTTGGHIVGKIRQKADCSRPVFSIQNAYDQEVLRIVGPMVTINCCSNVEFEVVTADDIVVGKVSKLWSGMAQEMFTDSDNFGINFPIDLDVNIKLTLMASVFLIVNMKQMIMNLDILELFLDLSGAAIVWFIAKMFYEFRHSSKIKELKLKFELDIVEADYKQAKHMQDFYREQYDKLFERKMAPAEPPRRYQRLETVSFGDLGQPRDAGD
ncbi:Oidioi.mRNA.OKI2018_I69.chr1.g1183.t1.cds [Oikopleura dioica]|uniref:Phospholipid scramblase n=1 Tax=Oikopleura dioica TaxID=34765 RepID=A0ABN7SQX7_OIKDI|nr:Oidioi.mRNA.OKI2018_I69.chr1.g1183.t1.cds [Oikopleura dioica]